MKRVLAALLLSVFLAPALSAETLEVRPAGPLNLQEALEQAQEGDEVLLGEGIYKSDTAWSINGKTGLVLKGQGEVWLICRDAGSQVLSIEGSESITVQEVKLRHEEPLEEGGCEGSVIAVRESRAVRILNCELSGCGSVGVDLEASEELEISGCLIHHNSYQAVLLNECTQIVISYNTIVDNQSFLAAYGVDGLEIYGNLIAYNSQE